MRIDPEACVGCDLCVPYCPVEAIAMDDGIATIDHDQCVECGVCKRVEKCPTDAFYMQELAWPRSVRKVFSDPVAEHEETRIAGRGTEEIKTNDVTNRVQGDDVGVNVEFGRPGTATRLREVERVATEIAGEVTFEPENPLTSLMADEEAGRLADDVRDERVMSAILEFTVTIDELPHVLALIDDAADDLETVISLNASYQIGPDDEVTENALHDAVADTPYTVSKNGKTNVGLGRETIEQSVEVASVGGESR